MESLPVELIELIAEELDLAALRHLRLVCQELRDKVAATRQFIRYCTFKRVELRVQSLKRLERTLWTFPAASHLQHLVIVGVLCITTGLERTLTDRTVAEDLCNPIGAKRDYLAGLSNYVHRKPATEAEIEDARAQLAHFQWRIRTAEAERASGQEVKALVAFFEAIRARCRAKSLRSLSLDVVVYREKTTLLQPNVGASPSHAWPVAAHVFSTTVQAWQKSGVSVEHFNAYGYLDACCVQTSTLQATRSTIDALRGLKALTLSLSNAASMSALHKIWPDPDGSAAQVLTVHPEEALGSGKSDATELAARLQQCPDLDRLDLRWYYTKDHVNHPTDPSKFIFQHIAHKASLPHLKKLRLRHFKLRAQDLTALLSTSPLLQSFDVQETTLLPTKTEDWGTIFATITSPLSHINHIYLDNLFVKQGKKHAYVVCYQHARPNRYVPTESMNMLNTEIPAAYGANSFRLGTRVEVLAGIRYEVQMLGANGRIMQHSIWLGDRRAKYGQSM